MRNGMISVLMKVKIIRGRVALYEREKMFQLCHMCRTYMLITNSELILFCGFK